MATIVGSPSVFGSGSYTPGAGSNRVILIAYSWTDNAADSVLNSVTIGGVSMHQWPGAYIEGDPGSAFRSSTDVWYITEADGIPSGSQAVTPTWSVSPDTWRTHCFTIQDADQSDFTVVDNDASGSTTSLAASLASNNDSFALAVHAARYNVGNTDTVWTWTGSTEGTDGLGGGPTQRYSHAYKNVTTGSTESIGVAWTGAVAVAAAVSAVLVKNFNAGSDTPLTVDNGSLSITGQDVTLTLGSNVAITVDNASLSLAGQDVQLIAGADISLAVTNATLTASGQSIQFTVESPWDEGILSLTGSEITLIAQQSLVVTVDHGTLTLTPQNVNLLADEDFTLVVTNADLTLTGQELTFEVGAGSVVLSVDSNTLTLNGQDVGISPSFTLSVTNGNPRALRRTMKLVCSGR
jgi:hypothetical protein